MARITSIGMPRKAFVPSATEKSPTPENDDAGPSSIPENKETATPEAKKRKRRGTRGKDPNTIRDEKGRREGSGWSRDADIARWTKLSAEHSESRRNKRVSEKHSATTCFACRSVGHAARDCPNVLLAAAGGQSSVDLLKDGEDLKTKADKAKGMKRKGGKKGGDVTGGFCYRWIHLPSATRVRADSLRCNATDHSLSFCPEPVDPADPTPYATCFICLGTGHLSSLCPANPGRGIYVNGGSCKLCGSTAHRAKDCELNVRPVEEETELPEKRRREVVLGNGEGAGTDEDDFMVASREQAKEGRVEKEGKRRRKKHPPAKNGERPAMTARARPEEDGDEGDSGRAGEVVVPVAAIAPATAPGKAKAKTKVVKF